MSNLKDGFMANQNKLHTSSSFEQNEYMIMDQFKFQNKAIVTHPHHLSVFGNYTDKIVYSANPINSTAFTNPSRVDIKIPARSNDVLYDNPWLLVRVSETANSSVTCAPFHLWFDRIEVQSSGRCITTYYGDDLYFYNLAIANDVNERVITDLYGNVATDTIPANGHAGYMIKLPFNKDNEIFLHGLHNDIILYCYTRNCVDSGSGTVSCNELSLIFNHKHLHSHDRGLYMNT